MKIKSSILLFYFVIISLQSYSQRKLNFDWMLENESNEIEEKASKEDVVTFTELIKMYPNDDSLYLERSEAKMFLKDYRGSIIDLNKAIELNPNYYHYYFKRAIAKSKLKLNTQAIVDFSKAIKLNDTNAILYSFRAMEKKDLKDDLGAINDLTTAIKLDPNYGKNYFWRGFVRFWRADYKNALIDFDSSVYYEENNLSEKAFYLIYRGKTKLKLGKKDDGCLDFSLAGELGSEDAYVEIKNSCN